jgi:hypothetical protein
MGSHKNVERKASEEAHCTSMQMSDHDLHDIAADPSSTELSDGVISKSTHDLLDNEIIAQAPVDPVSIEVITGLTEPCSCMTHSPFDANSASQRVLLSGFHLPIIVADSRVPLVIAPPPQIGPVELHDHGPPATSSPRYVLNSTFRI